MMSCSKCGARSGDDWTQCNGACPMPGSPDFAPVEASGSEREHGPKCWGKTSISDEMMYCYCGSTDSPPGETREALDRLKMAAHVYEDDEMAADCATLEALLSARPLALGGQQGDSETLRVLLDNLVIAQTLSKDIRQKATDESRSYLYDRRHTPARAEAQDEGAAGEPVAKVVRKGFSTGLISWTKFGQDADLSDETPLYAHPSPTPAADADRVRIAVEALDCIKIVLPLVRATYGPRHPVVPRMEALTALKSEGK